MVNVVKHKRSSTSGETPSASDLTVGELAVNTADAKLFIKHTDNSIKEISGGVASLGDLTASGSTISHGSGNITLDASGDIILNADGVGINTSPTEELHVNSDTSGQHTRVHITKGSNAGTAGVSFRSYSASNTWTLFQEDASASKFHFTVAQQT